MAELKLSYMKLNLENPNYKLTELSELELYGIHGGDFSICDPSNCLIAYASSVLIALIRDNIENPIGTSAGYPPK